MNIIQMIALMKRIEADQEALIEGIEAAAKIAQTEAKTMPGHYQPGWAELADYTKEDRVARGFTPNDPLKRSGDFEESIFVKREGDRVFFGSDDEASAFHEWGTSKEPPRPVFVPAMDRKQDEMKEAAGDAVVKRLLGK